MLDVTEWVEGAAPPTSGYVVGMPNEVYHAQPGASNSRLSRVARSPAHCFYEPPRKTTPAMRIGSAIHCAILEPSRFESDYLLMPETDSRVRSEYKQAVKHHDPDLILVGDEASRIAAVQATIYSDPHAGRLLESPGLVELSGFATDPETGAQCRHRFDKLTDDLIAIDIKKSRDASPKEFSRSVANYRYHVQAAFYSDQFFWITGKVLKAFCFVVIEDDPPHGLKVYVLDDEAMDIGRRIYRRDLNLWKKCMDEDRWPLYDSRPTQIHLPPWELKEAREEFGLVKKEGESE